MANLSVEIVLVMLLGVAWCSIPVSPTSDGLCWNGINNCLSDHAAHSMDVPKYNPASPSFNLTDFLCCPLLVQTAQTDKECFCVVDTVVHQDPSLAANVTTYLSLCGIVDSVPALDTFCLGIAPTPAEAPMTAFAPMMPGMPPL